MIDKRNRCYIYNINKSATVLNTGHLSVTVRNRLNNSPIAFAEVSIYFLTIRGLYGEGGEANLMVRHITDENGQVPLIELPVMDRSRLTRSQYYMTVNHFRYYPVNLMNIQIYPNVTTIYNVLLTPLTTAHPDYEFIITPELL
ncbi:MAG: hypothetical protein AB7V48_02920 [Sedimentibacter sp.]